MVTVDVERRANHRDGDSQSLQMDGTFLGSITLQSGSAVANNGFIEAGAESGLLTASYLDAANLSGSPITIQSLASVSDPQGRHSARRDDGERHNYRQSLGGDFLIDGDAGDDSISRRSWR